MRYGVEASYEDEVTLKFFVDEPTLGLALEQGKKEAREVLSKYHDIKPTDKIHIRVEVGNE